MTSRRAQRLSKAGTRWQPTWHRAHLGRDAGVVRPGDPERVVPKHAVPGRQAGVLATGCAPVGARRSVRAVAGALRAACFSLLTSASGNPRSLWSERGPGGASRSRWAAGSPSRTSRYCWCRSAPSATAAQPARSASGPSNQAVDASYTVKPLGVLHTPLPHPLPYSVLSERAEPIDCSEKPPHAER